MKVSCSLLAFALTGVMLSYGRACAQTPGSGNWTAYLANNRARGVLKLYEREHALYIWRGLDVYGAVLFPAKEWKRFFVFDQLSRSKGRVGPRLRRFEWVRGRLVERSALILIPTYSYLKKEKPILSGSLFERYLEANSHRLKASDESKVSLITSFVEYSMDPGNAALCATFHHPDGGVEQSPLISATRDPYANEVVATVEWVRRIGLPCPAEAKYFGWK